MWVQRLLRLPAPRRLLPQAEAPEEAAVPLPDEPEVATTGTVKRVVCSTLGAESNGLVAATEAADYLRSVILAANRPLASLSELLERGDLIPMQAYTDAKSLSVRRCHQGQQQAPG